jgi:adenine-specific DNA-methyltransferase
MRKLLGGDVMSYPKPTGLLQYLVRAVAGGDDIVMDFFSGSGTTGHAVMAQNALEGHRLRHVQVQLPEPLDPDNKDQKLAAEFCDKIGKPRNIAELTKERLRRAAAKIQKDHPHYEGDLGFRVFKLDSSNIRAWDPQPEDLEQTLLEHVSHLKEDRSEQDVLYELLLKLGLDLCVPIETKAISDKTVHSIGAGTLFACLDETLETDTIEELALGIVEWRHQLDPAGDTTVVFRDSAFPDDITKTNLDAILKQHNITTVRSI